MDAYRSKGAKTRFNLVEKDAPRDATGQFLRDTIPSDKVTEGRVFDICKRLAPSCRFNIVQVNNFIHHRQCQKHLDRKNVGDPKFALLGNCRGGWLWLEDGRRFREKKKWHTCDGAQVSHRVEAFTGTRHSVILYHQEASAVVADVKPEAKALEVGPSVLLPEGPEELRSPGLPTPLGPAESISVLGTAGAPVDGSLHNP